MRTQLRRTLLIVVLCALLLGGCGEVLNEYYISNHTDMALTVRLTPLYIETVDILAGSLIEDVTSSARSSLEQPVGFVQDDEVIQFVVSAKTTVFLGFSSGGNDLFSQIDLSSDAFQMTIARDNYKEYFTTHDNFVGAIVHVLNIKEFTP